MLKVCAAQVVHAVGCPPASGATLRMIASHAGKDFAPVAAGDSSRLPSLSLKPG